jgi:hypothetical protein
MSLLDVFLVLALVLGEVVAFIAGFLLAKSIYAAILNTQHHHYEQALDRVAAANLGQYREFHPAAPQQAGAPESPADPTSTFFYRDPTGLVQEEVPLNDMDPRFYVPEP